MSEAAGPQRRRQLRAPNVMCCNALLGSYSKCQQAEHALALLAWMEESGGSDGRVVPDSISFNTALALLARRGHAEGAASVYGRMTRAGVSPNPTTSNLMAGLLQHRAADDPRGPGGYGRRPGADPGGGGPGAPAPRGAPAGHGYSPAPPRGRPADGGASFRDDPAHGPPRPRGHFPPAGSRPGMGHGGLASPGLPPAAPPGAPYGAPYGAPHGAPHGADYGADYPDPPAPTGGYAPDMFSDAGFAAGAGGGGFPGAGFGAYPGGYGPAYGAGYDGARYDVPGYDGAGYDGAGYDVPGYDGAGYDPGGAHDEGTGSGRLTHCATPFHPAAGAGQGAPAPPGGARDPAPPPGTAADLWLRQSWPSAPGDAPGGGLPGGPPPQRRIPEPTPVVGVPEQRRRLGEARAGIRGDEGAGDAPAAPLPAHHREPLWMRAGEGAAAARPGAHLSKLMRQMGIAED